MNASFARLGRLTTFALVLALIATLGAPFAARPARAAGTTFTVTTAGDNPDANPNDGVCDTTAGPGAPCSLRAAIQQANATAGADTIAFNIPGPGLHTIRPASPLPRITEAVTVDGYSQPGAKPNTAATGTNAVLLIELDGSNVGAGAFSDGLRLDAANTLVRGLVINRFPANGIRVQIDVPTATGVRITGCFIGTDAAGIAARGNRFGGVFVTKVSAHTTIGGATPAARNLISGSDGNGVGLNATGFGTRVLGNLIGTDKSGAARLGNDAFGVASASPNVAIGGNDPAAANVIAFNVGDGVEVVNEGIRNRVLRNSIFANGGEGIDLGDDGPTANDAGDGDVGPNTLQNAPLLETATTTGGATTIQGRLDSSANDAFTLRFYANPAGGDEGKAFVGQATVTTNLGGTATFTFNPAQPIADGNTVTATATGANGDTSEFSPAKTVG